MHVLRTLPVFLLIILTATAWASQPVPFSPERAEGMTPEQQMRAAQRHLEQMPPDLVEARLWLEQAAAQGSTEAMGNVGWLYEQGLGVEANPQRAMQYYQQAYQAGENEFGLRIAWMYIHGVGMNPDRNQGEQWFRRIIQERNDSSARLALATILIDDAVNQSRERDPAPEARDLLVRALDDGVLEAAYYLTRMYSQGLGSVQQDRRAVVHYTVIGAQAGHPEMQTWLAALHLRGEGVERDIIAAYKWASLASAAGDSSGERLRRDLEQQLDTADIAQGRQRALRWLEERGQ